MNLINCGGKLFGAYITHRGHGILYQENSLFQGLGNRFAGYPIILIKQVMISQLPFT